MTAPLQTLIDEMDQVVAECRERGDRAGYFAALYRNVTREVARRSAAGQFADPERMALFTTAFARRYLDAYSAWRDGRTGTTVVRFSLVRARKTAWHTAQRLAPMAVPERDAAIVALDRDIHGLSMLVTRGPVLVNVGAFVVRLRERSNVRQVIDVLAKPVVLPPVSL